MKDGKTKKNPFEDLDKKFNTKEVTKALETNLRKTKDEKNLPAVEISRDDQDSLDRKNEHEDLEYARSILKQAESYNDEAIQGILHIARNSDQPRAYEVAGGLIKNLQDTAKDMLEVHEKHKRITAEDPKARKIQTQNNLFVGSTKDLLKAIKNDEENVIDVEANQEDTIPQNHEIRQTPETITDSGSKESKEKEE
jgi:hypothetical protein